MISYINNKLPPGFLAFACVGSIGFLVDASILSLLIFEFGWGHYSARVISFAVAVFVTWLLNRQWTFKNQASADRKREYSIYLAIQTIGALLNLLIYSICIFLSSWMMRYPVIPLAIGAGFAMLFNYSAARRYAFTGRQLSHPEKPL